MRTLNPLDFRQNCRATADETLQSVSHPTPQRSHAPCGPRYRGMSAFRRFTWLMAWTISVSSWHLATVTIPVNGSITAEADQSTHGRRVLAGGACGTTPAEPGKYRRRDRSRGTTHIPSVTRRRSIHGLLTTTPMGNFGALAFLMPDGYRSCDLASNRNPRHRSRRQAIGGNI
jgi:hypothetical protein